jgi:hypothetical protein
VRWWLQCDTTAACVNDDLRQLGHPVRLEIGEIDATCQVRT